MTTLYVQHDGCTLTRQDNTLVVQYRDNGEIVKQRIPVEKVNEVVIGTGCHITSAAIGLLLSMQVPVAFVDYHEQFIGALHTPMNGNQLLRREQYRLAERDDIALYLARQFISGKMLNQRVIVQRYAREYPDLESSVKEISRLATSLDAAPDIATMMGYEGQTARLYFAALGVVFGEAWQFIGRNRRPPRDPINALLSYGYAVLEAHITSTIHRVGLDPYVGFMHAVFPGRKSLALDLIEEFRPIIVDSAILGVIKNNMLKPDDFSITMGNCLLSEPARKVFLQRLQARLDQEVIHHITQEKITYSRLILAQTRLLASLLLGESTEYIPARIR